MTPDTLSTPEGRAEVRRLVEAATPGPWWPTLLLAALEEIERLERERTVNTIDTGHMTERETCATCRHFDPGTPKRVAYCSNLDQDTYDGLPADGSGYCWQWERKA